MKKILSAAMAFIMLFCLCACSGEQGEKFVPARGTVESGVYTNGVFGITFAGDENWYYYSDEEIAASMGLSAGDIPGADDSKALAEAGIIYDMYCANTATGGTVNITYEDLSATYGEVIDVEYYLELYQMEINTQLNSGNISIKKNEIGFAGIGEAMYPCLNIAADFGGLGIYETIIVKKCGDWLGVITIAALNEAELSDLAEKITFE
ncbi:MAG: hypothetical protein IJ306_07245 [Oscillospiraceae bacterium]|nr:hypothetical protein [Oscillospiraceae bacterium]